LIKDYEKIRFVNPCFDLLDFSNWHWDLRYFGHAESECSFYLINKKINLYMRFISLLLFCFIWFFSFDPVYSFYALLIVSCLSVYMIGASFYEAAQGFIDRKHFIMTTSVSILVTLASYFAFAGYKIIGHFCFSGVLILSFIFLYIEFLPNTLNENYKKRQ